MIYMITNYELKWIAIDNGKEEKQQHCSVGDDVSMHNGEEQCRKMQVVEHHVFATDRVQNSKNIMVYMILPCLLSLWHT